jgi:serine/threonine-protein kinase RsbW
MRERTVVVETWTRHPRAVGQARTSLRRELDSWQLDGLAEAAELVLSELLTNAVRHARVPRGRHIETRYERLPAGVRIEVHDADDTVPVRRQPRPDEESGRGLAVVDALTGTRWGVSGRQGPGKLVWAVVGEPQGAAQA